MLATRLSSLFLNVPAGVFVGVLIGAIVVVGALAFFVGFILHKKQVEKKMGEVDQRIKIMLDEAESESKALKKEAILEAKEQDLKLRNEFERETKEKKLELQRAEQRLQQKEDNLDKKEDSLQKRSDSLDQQQKNLSRQENEIKKMQEKVNHQHDLMVQELEKVAQLTKEEAKKLLTENILDEARHDVAVQVRNIEQQAKDEAETNAKKVISLAIQRCASDHASEITVSVVPLPNDDMKARIIGREGRNIRALENATGIELIIDDTPEVVILSGFDPVRREVARLSLHQLVIDGRIHPARIEEVVAKVSKQLDDEILETGKRTCIDLGIHGLNIELVKLIGRMKYRSSYGQNLLQHSREVANICATMASELGLNPKIARRAGLLHDIGKVCESDPEYPHAILGAKMAEQYKERPEICNAIGAHHEEMEMTSIYSPLVLVADAISGARPGARREVIESYIKRLEGMENLAASYPGVTKAYAIQAGRELRVIVGADEVSDDQASRLSTDIAQRIQDEMTYPGQVKITVIRETRSVAIAK